MKTKYIIGIVCLMAILIGAVSGYQVRESIGENIIKADFEELDEFKEFLSSRGYEVAPGDGLSAKKGDVDLTLPCENLEEWDYGYKEEDGKAQIVAYKPQYEGEDVWARSGCENAIVTDADIEGCDVSEINGKKIIKCSEGCGK